MNHYIVFVSVQNRDYFYLVQPPPEISPLQTSHRHVGSRLTVYKMGSFSNPAFRWIIPVRANQGFRDGVYMSRDKPGILKLPVNNRETLIFGLL